MNTYGLYLRIYGGTAGIFWPLSIGGGATSTPRNSCSFGRKKIIKTGICSLRLGKYKNTCFPEILDCCGGITRKSCDPCKKQGPKHTSCTIVHPKLLHAQQPHPLDRLQLSNQPADVKPQKALLQVIETTVVAQNLSNYRSQWQLVGLLVRFETSSYENGKPNMDVSLCRTFGWHKMNHSAIKFSWRGLSRTTVILWRKSKGLTDNRTLRSCRPAAELAIQGAYLLRW
jgi:hypothetical protein